MTTSGRDATFSRGAVARPRSVAYSDVDTFSGLPCSLLAGAAFLALLGEGVSGLGLKALLVLDPALVLVDRQRDHSRAHVGVVVTAELGANTLEDRRAGEVPVARVALLGDLEPRLVRVLRVRRGRVGLAAELRDPPGVDDVGRLDVEDHG